MDKNKKLHQEYLADIRCDVSQHSEWRCRLFDHAENTAFEITSSSIRDIFLTLAENIDKYDLKFIVEKVNSREIENSNDIIFKFYPKNYPELVKYSFNNPESR